MGAKAQPLRQMCSHAREATCHSARQRVASEPTTRGSRAHTSGSPNRARLARPGADRVVLRSLRGELPQERFGGNQDGDPRRRPPDGKLIRDRLGGCSPAESVGSRVPRQEAGTRSLERLENGLGPRRPGVVVRQTAHALNMTVAATARERHEGRFDVLPSKLAAGAARGRARLRARPWWCPKLGRPALPELSVAAAGTDHGGRDRGREGMSAVTRVQRRVFRSLAGSVRDTSPRSRSPR
jgi:hypothetical protein